MLRCRLLLFNALCCLNAGLSAESDALLVGDEPRIIPSGFAASDTAGQPIALWTEQGSSWIGCEGPTNVGAALLLPAQRPTARVCILLDAPEARISLLRLRLRLAVGGESGAETPDALEWDLAGVPLRLSGGVEGRWLAEFHTTETGWHPLPGGNAKNLGGGWHTLALEFSISSPRHWRLRWDDCEPSSWLEQERGDTALLVVNGGAHTDVWLDDIVTAASVLPASPTGESSEETAAALAARNAALRAEIAAALNDLIRETGVRRQLLRRSAFTLRHTSFRSAGKRRLEVLTPLEGKQSINETQ